MSYALLRGHFHSHSIDDFAATIRLQDNSVVARYIHGQCDQIAILFFNILPFREMKFCPKL